MKLIVAGIGTDIGKTIVSAVLCESSGANYWKPVQAGSLDDSDSHQLQRLVSRKEFKVIPEKYRLTKAMSPHAAAKYDGLIISREELLGASTRILEQQQKLIIEVAGGLMVPLSDNYLNIDFMEDIALPVVLVTQCYLGSINHTMLSIELLKSRKIPIEGLIFNGDINEESKRFILEYSKVKLLSEIPLAPHLGKQFIKHHAQTL